MNALLASEPAFLVVKFAVAAYLVYLGLHALWTAWRGGEVVIEAGARLDASVPLPSSAEQGEQRAVERHVDPWRSAARTTAPDSASYSSGRPARRS